MRQCNHSDGVRLFSDAPVVDVDTGVEGQQVRILCRRNLSDVILGMKLLTRSLPQNAATPKVVQHAVVETVADKVGA